MRDSQDEIEVIGGSGAAEPDAPPARPDPPPAPVPDSPLPPAGMGSPLPPPPPQAELELKRHRLVTTVGTLALIAGIVVGLGVFAAINSLSDSSDDAAPATTAAPAPTTAPVTEAPVTTIAPAGAAPDTADSGSDDETVTALQSELEDAQAEIDRLSADLEDAQETAEGTSGDAASLAAALATINELTVQNQEAADQIETLTAALAEAGGEGDVDSDVTPGDPPPVFDIDNSPVFARYIGVLLSSQNGRSVLGDGQTECLGIAVVQDIGLEAIAAGLEDGASTDANDVLVESMERSAPGCEIDLTALF